ncbi:MAG: cold shock domain-containing protein [Fibrobacterota bacterium]
MRGIIRNFNDIKGCGSLIGSDGKVYSFRYSDISGEGFRTLDPGEVVSFNKTDPGEICRAKELEKIDYGWHTNFGRRLPAASGKT